MNLNEDSILSAFVKTASIVESRFSTSTPTNGTPGSVGFVNPAPSTSSRNSCVASLTEVESSSVDFLLFLTASSYVSNKVLTGFSANKNESKAKTTPGRIVLLND